MSKKKLDEFLRRNEENPLDTDKVYGGNRTKSDDNIVNGVNIHDPLIMDPPKRTQ